MGAVLVVALIVVPLAEIWTIIQVAHVIGGWPTIVLLLAESLLGAWLVRREGRRAWQAFRSALEQHRPPAREVSDAALVLVGGALLLTPGFLTDIAGFLLLFPPTRSLARGWLTRLVARRLISGAVGAVGAVGPAAGSARRSILRVPRTRPPRGDRVVEGEVLTPESKQRRRQESPTSRRSRWP